MFNKYLNTAKNGHAYIKVVKDGKSYLVFDTEQYLIEHITATIDFGKYDVIHPKNNTLNNLFNMLTDENIDTYIESVNDKINIKETEDQWEDAERYSPRWDSYYGD